MESYDTLTEGLHQLRRRRYTADFNLRPEYLYCAALDLRLPPEGFTVDKLFRFEGGSEPAEQSILYAIADVGENVRGPG